MIFSVKVESASAGRSCASVLSLAEVTDFDEVVFFSWSSEESSGEAARKACEAVALLINRHLLNLDIVQPDWGEVIRSYDPGLQKPEQYYNYVYATPGALDDRFYFGKGIRDRWRSHFDVAAKVMGGEAVEAKELKETAKLDRINRHVSENPGLRAEDLCRIIAKFIGPYAELQSFAVEQYLIQRVAGIFALTNLNNGQGRHKSVHWQSRPRQFDTRPEAIDFWRDLLSRSQEWGRGKFAAHDISSLILHQLPEQMTASLASQLGSMQAGTPALQWLGLGIAPEGDLAIEANVIGTPVTIQLRFGFKDIECRINLRPARQEMGRPMRETFQDFIRHIRSIWPHAAIRNENAHPFLKPFAENQNGRKDVYFSAADLTAISKLSNCLLVAGEASYNLPEAVALVVTSVARGGE